MVIAFSTSKIREAQRDEGTLWGLEDSQVMPQEICLAWLNLCGSRNSTDTCTYSSLRTHLRGVLNSTWGPDIFLQDQTTYIPGGGGDGMDWGGFGKLVNGMQGAQQSTGGNASFDDLQNQCAPSLCICMV